VVTEPYSWRVSDELADGVSKFGWLVKRDERVAVGDLDQLPVCEQFSPPPPIRCEIDSVFRCPDHQCWTVKATEVFSRGKYVSLVGGMY
jgi:hypothetical protein